EGAPAPRTRLPARGPRTPHRHRAAHRLRVCRRTLRPHRRARARRVAESDAEPVTDRRAPASIRYPPDWRSTVYRSVSVLFALPVLVTAGYLAPRHDDDAADRAVQLVESGQHTFRYDTFGDEAFWSGALGLHRTIAGAANGGIGPGLSLSTAAAVGLKID